MNKPIIPKGMLNQQVFTKYLEEHGYVVVTDVLDDSKLDSLRYQLEACIHQEAEHVGGSNHPQFGMLAACPVYGGHFLKVVDNRDIMEPFEWILGDTCIIYVYTSSSLPPGKKNHAGRIHVDRPHFIPGYTEALGCLILLDDFTEENGATWVLPGSHQMREQPSEEYFFSNAERIIAPKGSVFYFHLRLWHAGGMNNTMQWRHSLGIGMVRGYLKQRIDLPRAMKNVDLSDISEYGLQKLGFLSQPPASLEEFYAPPEKRTYRQRSEWLVADQRG